MSASSLDRVPAQVRDAFAAHQSEELNGLLGQLWEKQERLDASMQRLAAAYTKELVDELYITSSVPAAQQPQEGGEGGVGKAPSRTPPPVFALDAAQTQKLAIKELLARDFHCTSELQPVLASNEDPEEPRNVDYFTLRTFADLERLAPSAVKTSIWRRLASKCDFMTAPVVRMLKGFDVHYEVLLKECQAAEAMLGKCLEKQAEVEELLQDANAVLQRVAALGGSFGPKPPRFTWRECTGGSYPYTLDASKMVTTPTATGAYHTNVLGSVAFAPHTGTYKWTIDTLSGAAITSPHAMFGVAYSGFNVLGTNMFNKSNTCNVHHVHSGGVDSYAGNGTSYRVHISILTGPVTLTLDTDTATLTMDASGFTHTSAVTAGPWTPLIICGYNAEPFKLTVH